MDWYRVSKAVSHSIQNTLKIKAYFFSQALVSKYKTEYHIPRYILIVTAMKTSNLIILVTQPSNTKEVLAGTKHYRERE